MANDDNLDAATVEAFGQEWTRFHEFTREEIEAGGREYFADLLSDGDLRRLRVLDVGCGSGRWTAYLAGRAEFVEAADPSQAAIVAARATGHYDNVRVIQASITSLPYAPATFDLVVGVGVLHHLPDTAGAIQCLAELIRPGGSLYLYLYYQLEDRPWYYRLAFHLANILRRGISRLPPPAKRLACDAAALLLYWPLISLAKVIRWAIPRRPLYEHVPLHYYIEKPWKIIRNDALDRFGTPLERRFSKADIRSMLEDAAFEDIRFGDAMPRWRVLARKAVRG